MVNQLEKCIYYWMKFELEEEVNNKEVLEEDIFESCRLVSGQKGPDFFYLFVLFLVRFTSPKTGLKLGI